MPNFADGIIVTLSDGNLTQSFTNQVQLQANNQVVNLGANGSKLASNPGNGLFPDHIRDRTTGKYLPSKGIVTKKQNAADGFFLNRNQNGEVFLGLKFGMKKNCRAVALRTLRFAGRPARCVGVLRQTHTKQVKIKNGPFSFGFFVTFRIPQTKNAWNC